MARRLLRVDNVPERDQELQFIAKSLRRLNTLVETFERCFIYLAVSDDIMRELLTAMPDQLDRIERAIIAIAENRQGRQITSELEQEILRAHIDSLKRQLKQQHKNKDLLEEEATRHGVNPPLYITNQIISIGVEIDKIKSELEHFKGLL